MALKDKAVLVDWAVGMWTASKQDNEITGEVLHEKEAESDAGKWIKKLVPDDWLKPLRLIKSQAGTVHRKYTVPYLRDGQAVCPNVVHHKYRIEMRQHEEKWEQEVEKKLHEYEALVRQAPVRMGKMYRVEDFPSAAAMARKFYWRIVTLPVPDEQNWVTYLVNGDDEQVKEELKQQIEIVTRNVSVNLWKRLYVVVKSMAEKLPEYTGSREGSFKDSLVDNIIEIVDLLPDLNVGEDQELNDMVADVKKKLCRFSAGELRQDSDIREIVTEKAKDILDRMSVYVGVGSILDD